LNMPITPLHIGVPALLGYFHPRRFDALSGIAGSVIIDLNFFLFLILGHPIHGIVHTYAAASVLSVVLLVSLVVFKDRANRLRTRYRFKLPGSTMAVATGAFVGTFTHVFFDSLLYAEMDPFYPVRGNPFIYGGNPLVPFAIVYGVTAVTTFTFLWIYLNNYFEGRDARPESKKDDP